MTDWKSGAVACRYPSLKPGRYMLSPFRGEEAMANDGLEVGRAKCVVPRPRWRFGLPWLLPCRL